MTAMMQVLNLRSGYFAMPTQCLLTVINPSFMGAPPYPPYAFKPLATCKGSLLAFTFLHTLTLGNNHIGNLQVNAAPTPTLLFLRKYYCGIEHLTSIFLEMPFVSAIVYR